MNKGNTYQQIYDHIELPIFLLQSEDESDFFIKNVNPAWEKMTGISLIDLNPKHPGTTFGLPKKNIDTLQRYSWHCYKTSQPIRYEEEFHFPTGLQTLRISLFPLLEKCNKRHCIAGFALDITKHKLEEQEFQRTTDIIQAIVEAAPVGIIGMDLDGNVNGLWNREAERMLGWKIEETLSIPFPTVPQDDKKSIQQYLDSIPNGKNLKGLEIKQKKTDGTSIDYSIFASPLRNSNGQITGNISILVDITAHKQIENVLKVRLHLIELANSHTMNELLTATLDELEFLTGSAISYYHFVNSEQNTIILQNWSTNTKKYLCAVEDSKTHSKITDESIWKECIKKRCPIIHNNYQSLPYPKEFPDGHPKIIRQLMVPIFRGKQIKAIIGVGNKTTNYDQTDIEFVSKLGDFSWEIINRKRAEEILRRSEEEKTILNQIAKIFLTSPDLEIYGEVLKIVLVAMKSKYGIFGYIGEEGELICPSLTSDIWEKCQVSEKSYIFPQESWDNTLWGRAIKEKKSHLSDGPFHTPDGHIIINHFLTVPVIYGENVIGSISVANKEERYTTKDKLLLEKIAQYISPILNARLQRDNQEQKRKAAEKKLRESEEKYRHLVTNADEAIFIVQDDLVKFPNPKTIEMTGYSEDELALIPISQLIHPEDSENVLKTYMGLEENAPHKEAYPFRILNKSGNELWVQLTTASIIWEKKPGILCFLKDITSEKKLEAQFLHAQKMEAVGRLAGGVAHDFNNMLLVIMGHAELALRKLKPEDPLYNSLQKIEKAAIRSSNLTKQLLAFARKQTISPQVLNLNKTVSGMLNMLRHLIGEDIDLVWQPGENLWPIKMDPSQIDQILANLCVNARDAIAGVGKITIETGNYTFDTNYCNNHAGFIPGDYVRLSVSDTGCGMNEETKKHIYEPFFTTKDVGRGTGLGLAMVYGIIKQNEGFLNLYSEPGQGTTFRIYFHRGDKNYILSDIELEVDDNPGGTETILIVEDETVILELSQKILDELGYNVLIAKTPKEAIEIAENYTNDIQLLFTDVVMPEMNGRELAEHLTRIKPNIKCLYTSGYTAHTIAYRGIIKNGTQFIQKPFSAKELAIRVRTALDQKPIDK